MSSAVRYVVAVLWAATLMTSCGDDAATTGDEVTTAQSSETSAVTTAEEQSSSAGEQPPTTTTGTLTAGSEGGSAESESSNSTQGSTSSQTPDDEVSTSGADEAATEEGSTTGAALPPDLDDCIEITPGRFTFVQGGLFRYEADLVGDKQPDVVQVEFYSGEVGTIDLAAPPNDDYRTCSQSVRVLQPSADGVRVEYFQAAGTMVVDEDVAPLTGSDLRISLSGVALVEVVIGDDFSSEPVKGGGCLTIADGAYATPLNPDFPDLPDGWTCEGESYGDGICHCGCGVLDSDCTGTGSDVCEACDEGCVQGVPFGCSSIDATDNTQCVVGPRGWTCSPASYGASDGCDCGCGITDPDCSDSTAAVCDDCSEVGTCSEFGCSAIDRAENALCLTAPEGWACSPGAYGTGDGCDCGCGLVDPDCSDATAESCDTCSPESCAEPGCALISPTDNGACVEWNCDVAVFNGGDGCDCGCGSIDPDCADQTQTSCETCDNVGSCAVADGCAAIDLVNNGECFEWTCDIALYNAGDGCHCGCGSVDPDCDDDSAASCDVCDAPSSCSAAFDDSCGALVPEDNGRCAWTCTPSYYGTDDGCDCGCGLFDPDCADSTVDSCGFCTLTGSCSQGAGCDALDPNDNSTCS